MGFQDRDYYRDPAGSYSTYDAGRYAGYRRTPPAFGGMQMLSVNTWLILICVAVFVLNAISPRVALVLTDTVGRQYLVGQFGAIEASGYFSESTAVAGLQVWRFITFQFLHANLEHIVFNMFALYFFGPMIESYLGRRRFLAFYLLCGVGGAVFYLMLWAAGLLITQPYVPLVGASAGIFGVLVAGARIAPNVRVLIYGIIPVRLKVMAGILLAIAVFTVLRNGNNAGGEAAHLGGAAVGFLLIARPNLLNVFELGARRR